MTHRRTTYVIVLAGCLALAGAAAARQAKHSLSGRVVLEASGPGRRPSALPRFTARLYAPKEMKRPTVVTYTDAAGNFKFEGLDAGPYLLEIYQESERVYQKELAVDGQLQQPLVITLRPRA
ncbi:MAG TPA: carboxypeptidase-like regulatory domain-containing protein [Pyrinomonadaceae bacterium]|nr:carboxypeptidase-like regulatory domain-containing protein [Pyrinomonadaceae bacterium]